MRIGRGGCLDRQLGPHSRGRIDLAERDLQAAWAELDLFEQLKQRENN